MLEIRAAQRMTVGVRSVVVFEESM
jgi:hypothetical protein